MRALRRLPALQRDEAIAAKYLGLRVFWKTRFFEVQTIDADPVKSFSFTQRGWHRWSQLDQPIYANIDIDRHPEIQPARRGRRFNLYGTINNVDVALGITLTLDRFEILPVNVFDYFVQMEDSRH